MASRLITEQEIETVLSDYHTHYHDRKGNDILIGHVNGRRIKVVVRKDSHPAWIITAAD